MEKRKQKNKHILYTSLLLIVSWIFIYLFFAFALADLNLFSWEESTRGGYLYCIIITIILAFPVSGIIKSCLND